MSLGLPEGFVDPTEPEAVSAVLAATVAAGGLDALTDLLGRLPGTTSTPAEPKGFLRAAVPASIWLGPETCWSCTRPPTLLQVVNGVVLHRDTVHPGEAAGRLARVVADLARRTGTVADASAVLTAARDVAAGS
jgi:hypothetical protein